MKAFLLILSICLVPVLYAQQSVHGTVVNERSGEPVPGATVRTADSSMTVYTDERGRFHLPVSAANLRVTAVGFNAKEIPTAGKEHVLILLTADQKELDAVVVSGTLRPVKKLESPVPVEVYTPQFFKKNPAPSIFESLQNVNGVRPQLNCSVCNTGDIHINGLEGPYTMITIDGMPIVSSLASVYGLFGIPAQLIDRVEIVKGPASGLYGAEAIGGLINIITKSPEKAPAFTANFISTSWWEHNLDLGIKYRIGKKLSSLLGINYFNYQQPVDHNKDRFQ
jgi:outer membrane receptor for ferrienterochelin and colicins